MLTQRQRATVALIGGAVAVSVVCAAIKRYIYLRELRRELNIITWDTKEVTWRDYVTGYKSDIKS